MIYNLKNNYGENIENYRIISIEIHENVFVV